MLKWQAILFDFDGTLVDSKAGVYEAYLSTFKYFYPNKSFLHIEKILTLHGLYNEDFKAIFHTDEVEKEIDDYLQSKYLEIASSETKLFEGVHHVIDQIESMALSWGIVTSKKRGFVERIIEATALSQGYSCLICEEDVKDYKPHPAPLIKACDLLGKKTQQVVYIGDALTDIKAAKACGMQSVAASYNYSTTASNIAVACWGADYVISDIKELVPIVSDNSALAVMKAVMATTEKERALFNHVNMDAV